MGSEGLSTYDIAGLILGKVLRDPDQADIVQL